MSDPDATGEHLTGDGDPATADGGGAGDGRRAPGPDESELLAAFDRMRPQGSLQWGFDDAMRRIARPETGSATAPWNGLPDDLWDRGRSARIGRRFVGDVARVLADLLAADARTAAAAAAAGVNVATWDALRYLAARVGLLEARLDPARPRGGRTADEGAGPGRLGGRDRVLAGTSRPRVPGGGGRVGRRSAGRGRAGRRAPGPGGGAAG